MLNSNLEFAQITLVLFGIVFEIVIVFGIVFEIVIVFCIVFEIVIVFGIVFEIVIVFGTYFVTVIFNFVSVMQKPFDPRKYLHLLHFA